MSVYTNAATGLSIQSRRFAEHADAITTFSASINTIPANVLPVDSLVIDGSDQSLESHIIGLDIAGTSYTANARVIKTQQEMDRSLLDITT